MHFLNILLQFSYCDAMIKYASCRFKLMIICPDILNASSTYTLLLFSEFAFPFVDLVLVRSLTGMFLVASCVSMLALGDLFI